MCKIYFDKIFFLILNNIKTIYHNVELIILILNLFQFIRT